MLERVLRQHRLGRRRRKIDHTLAWLMNILLKAGPWAGKLNFRVWDLRYEGFRLKASALEERLLGSIAQRGIEEPLEGVETKGKQRVAQRVQAVSLCAQVASSHGAL